MQSAFEKRDLAKKSENISEWYHDVVLRAGLADYSETKGSMIIKPRGYALWEKVQATLDAWFKTDGVENAYFPLLIPYSLLEKEREHLEGFSPELAVVTHAGGEKLAEPYVVRPTSETIMYQTFAKWIQSWRDLPLKINQWANVVRWEKRTYPFLRTTEFLWQEGHTVHASEKEAVAMALKALDWYRRFYEEYFAISVYAGIKSKAETFAGAKTTYSIELVIPDGKALQGGTSHNLSDNFSHVFGIEFTDENGTKRNPFQTSWGLSTRSIGGLILTHGDDSGLIIPPAVASPQIAVLAIAAEDDADARANAGYAEAAAEKLRVAGVRVNLDADFTHSLGYRINDWELRGVPVRLEIGTRERERGAVTAVRRDTFEKVSFGTGELTVGARDLLERIQQNLFARSEKAKRDLTVETRNYEEFKNILANRRSFIRMPWCEGEACEQKIKEETRATPRVLELERMDKRLNEPCPACGHPAHRTWLFAQSY